MGLKQLTVLLLYVFFLHKINSLEFQVVSTTSGYKQNIPEESCPSLKEINYRLLTLELQNERIYKTCALNEKNSNFDKNELLEKIEKFQNKMIDKFDKIIEMKQNEMILQRIGDKLFAKINNITDKIFKRKETKKETSRKNCLDLFKNGNKNSGVYSLNSSRMLSSVETFCDMDTEGGGWTYILRRFDGSQNFDLKWADYKNGFGKPNGEYWLGLEAIYQLTNQETNELLVQMMDWDNRKTYAHYKQFRIGSEEEGYPLKKLEEYNGDAGDVLSSLINMKFSTKDMDRDLSSDTNCGIKYKGAWWFRDCYVGASKLTGMYLKDIRKSFNGEGIHWLPLHLGTLQDVKMMIRPLHSK